MLFEISVLHPMERVLHVAQLCSSAVSTKALTALKSSVLVEFIIWNINY